MCWYIHIQFLYFCQKNSYSLGLETSSQNLCLKTKIKTETSSVGLAISQIKTTNLNLNLETKGKTFRNWTQAFLRTQDLGSRSKDCNYILVGP